MKKDEILEKTHYHDEYIVSYELSEDESKIVCHMSHGEPRVIPWSVKNEEKIKEVMEKQAYYFQENLPKIIKQKKYHLWSIPVKMALATGAGISANYFFQQNVDHLGYASAILAGVLGLAALSSTLETFQYRSVEKDVNKHSLYLDNRDYYEMKEIDTDYLTTNLSEEGVNQLLTDWPEEGLDINKINDFSYDDLKKLRENLLFYCDYGKEKKLKKSK